VREAYRFFTNNGTHVDRTLVDDVWHKHIPSKVSLFVWRLLCNRLPTQDNLVRRNVLHAQDSVCVAGCGQPESVFHLFLDCVTFSSLWVQVLQWLGISLVLPADIRLHCIQFTHMASLPRVTHSFLTVIWFAFVWAIWKERDNRIFQNKASDSLILVEKVKLNSFLWLKSKQAIFNYSYHDWWKYSLPCIGVQV